MLVDGRTSFGASAEYTCDADYIIRPTVAKRKCESNGRWSRNEIACDIIECPVPRAPAGTVTVSPDETRGGQPMDFATKRWFGWSKFRKFYLEKEREVT